MKTSSPSFNIELPMPPANLSTPRFSGSNTPLVAFETKRTLKMPFTFMREVSIWPPPPTKNREDRSKEGTSAFPSVVFNAPVSQQKMWDMASSRRGCREAAGEGAYVTQSTIWFTNDPGPVAVWISARIAGGSPRERVRSQYGCEDPSKCPAGAGRDPPTPQPPPSAKARAFPAGGIRRLQIRRPVGDGERCSRWRWGKH